MGTFLFFMVASYLYFCVIYHVMNRKNLLSQANLTFRKTTYEIFQRAVEFKQLDIDQRMMILVSALDPLREIIFTEKSWDKRGV